MDILPLVVIGLLVLAGWRTAVFLTELKDEEIKRRGEEQAYLNSFPPDTPTVIRCKLDKIKVSETPGSTVFSTNNCFVHVALNGRKVSVQLFFDVYRNEYDTLYPTFASEKNVSIFDATSREWVLISKRDYANPMVSNCIEVARDHVDSRIRKGDRISFSRDQELIHSLARSAPPTALSRATAPDENPERGVSLVGDVK